VFVINLDSRGDRWLFQQAQSRILRIPINRVRAQGAAEGRRAYPTSPLTDGALGLWATFTNLCEELTTQGVTTAVLLEDDAVLHPMFVRRLSGVLEQVPPSVAVVQLGYLKESSWRRNKSVWRNVRSIARPRSRLRALRRGREQVQRGSLVRGGFKSGTHALLVRPQHVLDVLADDLPPGRLPLDMALKELSRRRPCEVVRVEGTLAHQLPVRSDIPVVRRTQPSRP
jgi:hypothetical protein